MARWELAMNINWTTTLRSRDCSASHGVLCQLSAVLHSIREGSPGDGPHYRSEQTHTHERTHARTNTHTHAHIYCTHTHTRTHTHADNETGIHMSALFGELHFGLQGKTCNTTKVLTCSTRHRACAERLFNKFIPYSTFQLRELNARVFQWCWQTTVASNSIHSWVGGMSRRLRNFGNFYNLLRKFGTSIIP